MAIQIVDGRNKTFGFRTARDMFRKLQWEREQASNAVGNEHERYFALNMAWTAFHTLDWIAADLIDVGRYAEASVACGWIAKDDTFESKVKAFKAWARSENPFLLMCANTANASKHRNLLHSLDTFEAYSVETSFDPEHTHHTNYFSLKSDTLNQDFGVNWVGHHVVDWIQKFLDEWLPEK